MIGNRRTVLTSAFCGGFLLIEKDWCHEFYYLLINEYMV